MMKRLSWLVLSAFIFPNLFAQNIQKADPALEAAPQGIGFCAQHHVHQLASEDAAYRQMHEQIEQRIYGHFQKNKTKRSAAESASPPPYTLPVVVHVIHNGGVENIPDVQVIQGIQDLNDAFANVGYYNPATGVNTQIQFCLAMRDPDGSATTGINRVQSPLTDMNLDTDDITVKDLSRWDPLEYINIWLVREICSSSFGCGVAGYAYFPTSHGQPEDGIMMEAEFFGSSQGASGVQVHEMGHYLGLYHTFQGGCPNNDCLADGDRVCDTPPDQSTAWLPCGTTANSCSTDTQSGFPTDQDDLVEDYMDYNDFDCYSMFTQGQTDRMHWHIENVRSSLLDSDGCLDPCLSSLSALFSPSATTLDVGGMVSFSNFSVNTTTAEWSIDGTLFSTNMNADYLFNSVGNFEICLAVGNDDPNCSDVFCQNINVTCPVQSAFSTNVFYPNPGEVVSYVDGSTNATQYEWTVNGTPVANTQNLDYAFADEGIYDLCLSAGNGLCADEFCMQVFVAEGTSGGCDNATFVRIFGETGVDEEGMTIVPSGDGNLYLGGRSGGQTLIVKMDINGDPIWQRSFDFTSKNDLISQLLVDSDGNVVGCGYGEDGSVDFIPYVFKYDPVADAVLWNWNYSNSSRCFNIIEPIPGGDYIVTMDMRNSPSPGAFEDAILREIDRTTGAMTGNLATSYNLGSSETFSNTILHNGQLYMTGRYTNGAGTVNMRHSISRFDLNGNEIWSKLSHVSTAGSARLYGRDMLMENDEIISIASGDDNGSSATITNFFLQKNDLDGNLIWAKKYEIPSMQNEWTEEIVSTADGFLMLGYERNSPNELFVVKTDKDGEVLWAKSYGDAANEGLRFTCESQMLALGNFIYFTAWSDSFNGSRDIILVKTDSEGNLEDDCLLGQDITVNMTPVNNPANVDFDLIDYPNPQSEINVSAGPETPNVPFQDLEGCACVPDSECDTTFLKTYGTLQDDEVSHAIASVPLSLGGGFLLGGGKADSAMITWVDNVGDIIWTRSFDATFNAEDFIWDIRFDSDDMVVGVGNTKNEPDNNVECFAFRYDMATNTMLWINELDLFDPAHENYYSIAEKAPGGNFIVSGQTNDLMAGGTGCDGIIVELDRNSGANVWQHNLTFGSCETFSKTIIADGGIYSTGRYNFDGGGTSRMRPGITKFDLSGNQLWSRFYIKGPAPEIARLYSADLLDDNGLTVFGHGDFDGTATDVNELFIIRTDYDGNVDWVRQYDIPSSTTERARRIINLPDGYLCLGQHDSPDRDAYIFKVDKQGMLQWAKNYGDAAGDEEGWDMLWQSGQVYFTGKTTTPTGGVSEDIYLANIAADGTVSAQDSCNLFTDLDMTEAPWADPYDGQHFLEDLGQNWNQFLTTALMGETAVQSTVECFIPCLDTCDLVPEALFEGASATCGGDGLDLELTVCNTGNFDLPTGTPITIYDADPTVGVAIPVATLPLDEAVEDGECVTFSLTFSGQPNATYFVLINDDGSSPTPIDLTTFEGVEDECDFTNNIGSFIYDYEAPILDLGPNITACENLAVTLDAGPGFADYEWNDGSDEQTLTTIFPGTYSVTVTDECGGTQSDEITISIDPSSVLQLGPDMDICEGQVLQYGIGGFENLEWIPSTGVTCDDPGCTSVDLAPTDDITYIVIGSNPDGCFSVDTLTITVSENIQVIEDVAICEGDTVIVFGEPVFEIGEFSMTFTAENGCDSIHTISVGVLDTIVTHEDIFTCFSQSVEIFGTFTSTAGVYEMTFESETGCDSTHIITLTVNDAIIFSLLGDSPSCFGSEDGSITASATGGSGGFTYLWDSGETTPELTGLGAGGHTVTVTDMAGCTAAGAAVLNEPDEIMLSIMGNDVSCTDLGSATVSATGGTGDFTFEWSNGETTAEITDLEAGIYSVTATDENECTAVAEIEIMGVVGPSVNITIDALPTEDEPTAGALTAEASGGMTPYIYEWSNGGTGASQMDLPSGQYTVTVTDDNGCTATASVAIYLAGCTGGKIWNDADRDGCQDGGELGIGGIELELNGIDIFGNAVTMTTTTAINGEYIFEPLPPGDYQVTLPLPSGYAYSPVDACSDDFTDSDFDADGESYIVELEEGHCCLIVDGGLYDACLNVYDPGEICCDQYLCGPGLDPAPITSVSPAQGAFSIEYMWMYTHEMGAGGISFSNGNWTGIPGTNSPSYDPDPVQQTTYFARCVRAVGCTEWLETNVVEIFVDDVAVADIVPPNFICVGSPVTFQSVGNPAGASYAWNFGPTASPSVSASQNPTVTFMESGYPTVTLSVTYNDCTSTDTELLGVSGDPVYCGTAIQVPDDGTIEISENEMDAGGFSIYPNPTTDYLTVRWSTAFDTPIFMEMMGVDGRRIFTAETDGNAQFFQTDLSKLVPGVYVLQVKYGEGKLEAFRVVKE